MDIAQLKDRMQAISQLQQEPMVVDASLDLFREALPVLKMRDGSLRDKPGVLASMISSGVAFSLTWDPFNPVAADTARRDLHRSLYNKMRDALAGQKQHVDLPTFEDAQRYLPAPPEDLAARRRRLSQKWADQLP